MRVCWLSYESEVDFAHYDAKKQFQELDPFLFNLQEKKNSKVAGDLECVATYVSKAVFQCTCVHIDIECA